MPTLRKFQNMRNSQWASQFDLVFTSIPGASAFDLDELTVRASTQAFPFPQRVHAITPLKYRGLTAQFAAPLDETSKEFQVELLLDEGWYYYDIFDNWKNLVYDDETGQVGDWFSTTTTMSAIFYNSDGNPSKVFNFEGVQIKGIKPMDPDPGSSEMMRVTCEFIYMLVTKQP
jgi:hypothetical protein